MKRLIAIVVSAAFAPTLLAGCGSGSADLTLYNAQHQDLMEELVDGFTEETGIEVEMRNGDDSELANQIVQEGNASPADVFVTENSPAMNLVDGSGLFAELDAATLAQVPDRYAASDGKWVGFAARSTVFAYDSRDLQPSTLPASILDLAKPEWKDRFGISPAGADFQAIVSAVLHEEGEATTAEWLRGVKANARVYRGNIPVMQAINNGEIDGGVIYHYYWFKDRAESGQNSANVELHYFGNQDPGAFVSVSGAGVVSATDNAVDAQRFVNYITGPAGQAILARSNALEYTVGNGQAANEKLKPLDQLGSPEIDPATLNGPKVTDLMRQAGLL